MILAIYTNCCAGVLHVIQHVSPKFYDVIMAPSLSVTVNERQVLSAAEMLMYQHMYFLSHPSADRREVSLALSKPNMKQECKETVLTYACYLLLCINLYLSQVTTEDYYTAVLGPWEQRLRSLGAVSPWHNKPLTLSSIKSYDSRKKLEPYVLIMNLHTYLPTDIGIRAEYTSDGVDF